MTDPTKILAELRRPFPAESVRIKLQTKRMAVPYLDARLVIDRLNQVAALEWQDEYEILSKSVICKLTVCGISRYDVGEPGDGEQGTSPKAVMSDALKRAAVKFGIGLSLYATPKFWVTDDDVKVNAAGKPVGLKPMAEKRIRSEYAKWLETDAGKQFGAPLEVTFTAESAGDAIDGQADLEPTSVPLDGAPYIEGEVRPDGTPEPASEQPKRRRRTKAEMEAAARAQAAADLADMEATLPSNDPTPVADALPDVPPVPPVQPSDEPPFPTPEERGNPAPQTSIERSRAHVDLAVAAVRHALLGISDLDTKSRVKAALTTLGFSWSKNTPRELWMAYGEPMKSLDTMLDKLEAEAQVKIDWERANAQPAADDDLPFGED